MPDPDPVSAWSAPILGAKGITMAFDSVDVLNRLGQIGVPALIVTSNEGMAYEESLRMHRLLPRSELWAPPDVGHSPHVEIPEKFNQRVLKFLRSVE